MTKLSFNGKRMVVGVALAMVLVCLVNHWLDLRLFGEFGKQVLIVSVAILGVVVLYLGPTLKELQEHRDRRRNSGR